MPRRLPVLLSLKEAVSIAGTLGHPSKMPGYSYGISAKHCITGSELRKVPGSVCSMCFARQGWYEDWVPLALGHARRELGLRHPRWIDAMVAMINHHCKPPNDYFRFHDSGDIQGVWHLENILEVVRRTPSVKHWMPTREYGFVAEYLASGKEIPVNIVIRLSAHMIDSEPVLPPDLVHLPVSVVSSVPWRSSGVQIVEGKGSVECRAIEARDNKCGPCRACWEPRVKCVSYPQH